MNKEQLQDEIHDILADHAFVDDEGAYFDHLNASKDIIKLFPNHLERVADWNKRFMRPQLSEPGIPPEHLWKLRIKLLREEVQELEDAYIAGDVIGVLDAQLDISVVNLGGVAEAGLTEVYDLGFEEVMRANDSKADKDGNPILRPEDGKIMKSDLYTPPNLTKFFKI